MRKSILLIILILIVSICGYSQSYPVYSQEYTETYIPVFTTSKDTPFINNSIMYESGGSMICIGVSELSDPVERLRVFGKIGLYKELNYYSLDGQIAWGNYVGGNFSFIHKGSTTDTYMTILGENGNVGIGTTLPEVPLHVNGAIMSSSLETEDIEANNIYSGFLQSTQIFSSYIEASGLIRSNTGIVTPAIVVDETFKLTLSPSEGYVLTSDADGIGTWQDISTLPGMSEQYWTKSETTDDIYRIDGNVGIGTSSTSSYRLSVNGSIQAELLKIIADVPASDYVFEKDYKLMNLYELETFINNNKHLPEVKSAEEFVNEGYTVGEMDDVLLRKVEELTLYTIEQQKQLDKSKEVIDDLLLKIEELTKMLDQMSN